MGVEGVNGTKRHFSGDEEALMQNDPSTTVVLNKVKADAGGGDDVIDVTGEDKTWREVKDEQHGHIGVAGATELVHVGVDCAHLAEFHAVEGFLAAGAGAVVGASVVVGGSIAALGLGVYELHEANVHGDEQAKAIAKDEMHVALLTHVELPGAYKADQLAQRDEAGRGAQSLTQKMTTPLAGKDKALVAVLQLHVDRGMNAARDFIAIGGSKEAFFSAHPKLAEAYAKDAAFHHGFDALVFSKDHAPAEYKETCAKLAERDGWYQQSNIRFAG